MACRGFGLLGVVITAFLAEQACSLRAYTKENATNLPEALQTPVDNFFLAMKKANPEVPLAALFKPGQVTTNPSAKARKKGSLKIGGLSKNVSSKAASLRAGGLMNSTDVLKDPQSEDAEEVVVASKSAKKHRSPIGGSLLASIEAHPGYTGLAPRGMLQVRSHAQDGIVIQGVLTGMPANQRGLYRIFDGFSCEDYQESLLSQLWSADERGMAGILHHVERWNLWGTSPLAGHALVIQDHKGVKIGCGLLELTSGRVTHLDRYPGRTDDAPTKGILVAKETAAGVLLAGTLGGLPPLSSGAVRIHSGHTCTSSEGVGTNYEPPSASDPSAVTPSYRSDANGSAQVSLLMRGFSLSYDAWVAGRTVVVQSKPGKLGCGVIGRPETLVAFVGTYPLARDAHPRGTLAVTATKDGIHLEGILAGLPFATEIGVTIHTGFSCTYSESVKGPFTRGSGTTWTAFAKSDDSGVAAVAKDLPGFSISDDFPVAGRVLVIAEQGGVRIGCARLQVSNGQVTQLNNYPGYTGSAQVRGTLITSELRSGIQLQGTITGLPASSVGGYHIHRGFTCSSSKGVGGPYAGAAGSDGQVQLARSPSMTATYTSDASGMAHISEVVSGLSVYETSPVLGRAIVFQDSGSSRIACGVVGRAENLVASMGAFPGYNDSAPRGTVHAMDIEGGVWLRAVLTGLPNSSIGGIRIHSGFSCANVGVIGDEYVQTKPLKMPVFKIGHSGTVKVALEMKGFSLNGAMPVAGRTLVLYDKTDFVRIGCGVLKVTPGHVTYIGSYEGENENARDVKGIIVTEEQDTGITMRGTIAGLPPKMTAGFHVASGYSCSGEKGLGGHYHEGMVRDPWNVAFHSNENGAAQVSLNMKDFSLFSQSPILGRAIVVSAASRALGCGATGPGRLYRLAGAARAGAEAATGPAGKAAAEATASAEVAEEDEALLEAEEELSKKQKGIPLGWPNFKTLRNADSPFPLLAFSGAGLLFGTLFVNFLYTLLWYFTPDHWALAAVRNNPEAWEGVDGLHRSHIHINRGHRR